MDPLHTVLQSYPAIIYWLDKHLRIQGCNKAFMRHFDMRSADEAYDICLRSLHSAGHPHAESWYQNNLQAMNVQQPVSHVQELYKIDGQSQHYESVKLLVLSDQKVTGLVSITRLHVPSEHQLMPVSKRDHILQQLLHTMSASFTWHDAQGAMQDCNQHHAKRLGHMSPKSLHGKHFAEYLPADETQLLQDIFEKIDKHGKPVHSVTSSAEQPHYHIHSPVHTDDQSLIGVASLSMPLPEAASDLVQLKEKNRLIDQESQRKTMLIQNISNHLRAPLMGLSGMMGELSCLVNDCQAMLQSMADEESILRKYQQVSQQHERLSACSQIATSAVDGLMLSFDSLREVMQFSSNQRQVDVEDFSLHRLLHSVERMLAPLASKNTVEVLLDVDSSVPEYVISDPVACFNIVRHLLHNAIKFSLNAVVKIKISLSMRGQDHVLSMAFVDNGSGVAPDKKEELFTLFTGLSDATDVADFDGRGTGLYVVKHYVESLAGAVSFDSRDSAGSTFIVTLPIQLGQQSDYCFQRLVNRHAVVAVEPLYHDKSMSVENPDPRATRVLLVEDHPSSAMAASLALKRLGCAVQHARTGKEAVSAVAKLKFNVIFCDFGLPDVKGPNLVKQLRAMVGSDLPIIALTGQSQLRHRNTAVNAWLQKPALGQQFEEMLQKHVRFHSIKKTSEDTIMEIDIIDWDQCVAKCGGAQDSALQLLSICVSDLVNSKTVLLNAVQDKQEKALMSEVHRLAGGVCYLRLPRLEAALHVLQNLNILQHGWDECVVYHDAVQDAIDEVIRLFEQKFKRS